MSLEAQFQLWLRQVYAEPPDDNSLYQLRGAYYCGAGAALASALEGGDERLVAMHAEIKSYVSSLQKGAMSEKEPSTMARALQDTQEDRATDEPTV